MSLFSFRYSVIYAQHEFVVIIITESLSSLIIILIITNSLTNLETRIRNRLPTRRRMEVSMTTSSASSASRPFAMSLRGYQTISQQEQGNGV